MVEVRIIIEGGAPDGNSDVATVDNSPSLRQSLHRIFSETMDENVTVVIDPGSCDRAAAKKFAKQSEGDSFLYVDLDDCKANIANWFKKMESGIKPVLLTDNQKGRVFFMIQEMEAWILKQPEAIELWAREERYVRKQAGELTDHTLLRGRNIEDIHKPSWVLANLIKIFYQKQSSGTPLKVSYGKLKTAPSLLDRLDVDKLKETDSEFNRFVSVVSQP